MLFKSGFPKLPPESVYLLMLFTAHNLFDSQVWLETKVKWSGSVVSYSLWPPWTIAYQAPLSVGFSRQEYWSGLPFPSPGALPNPGIEPGSPTLQTDAFTISATMENMHIKYSTSLGIRGVKIKIKLVTYWQNKQNFFSADLYVVFIQIIMYG